MNFWSLAAALCTAISVTSFVLLIGSLPRGERASSLRRLDKPLPLLFKIGLVFVPFVRKLADSASCAAWRKSSHEKLMMAGYDGVLPERDFVALQIVFAVFWLLFLLFGASARQMLFSALIGTLIFIFPHLWLQMTIRKRQQSMMKALPNVLDLLTLSVESGRDLISSLRDILERRRMDDLGEELTRTFQEIQIGRKRSDALRDLAQRVKQVDLTSVVNAMIQAEEYGVSIGQLLKIQGDMLRNKRFALAEKLANESSVKIIIPVVVCILPSVFIVLVGPLLAHAFRLLS